MLRATAMSETRTTTLRISIDVALDPNAAFPLLVEELANALARLGLRFEPDAGGRVCEGGLEVGRVASWKPGLGFTLTWRLPAWADSLASEVEVRLERCGGGTRVILEHRGFGACIGEPGELLGWFASEMAAPLLRASAPAGLGDWITDRRARRPSGPSSRAIYRDPLYHYPGFRVMLAELRLTRDDYLLEVGCGGGAMLREALRSGCRAAAIDHSADMIRLAREENAEAVASGRLEVHEADATRLPFADFTFTCAAMTGALGFLPDPVGALAEIRRVLRPGGRLVLQGTDPEMKGTPAAPEPMASRLRFYDDADLDRLGRDAGFEHVEVVRRDLEPHARAVGIPEEVIPLFSGPGSRFLLARKGR
jgi:SAM-dependent methyltransferase